MLLKMHVTLIFQNICSTFLTHIHATGNDKCGINGFDSRKALKEKSMSTV